MVAFLLAVFLCLHLGALGASAEEPRSCVSLVEGVLEAPVSFSLRLRAGAKTTESLEAEGPVYAGVFFELPLVDPSAAARKRRHRREKEALLAAIAEVRALERAIALRRDLLRYHRRRIDLALEDNRDYISVKLELEELRGRLLKAEAKLKAYGLSRKEALSCRW